MFKICSYDVFDTCLTRRWAAPADLFVEIGRRLEQEHVEAKRWPDGESFRAARLEAERRARARTTSEEVRLDEIWAELTALVGEQLRPEYSQVELKVESESLAPVHSLREQLGAARKQGSRVVFVSDTYLPRQFVEEQLLRHGMAQRGDGVYVSSEVLKTKQTGNLFKHMLASEKVQPGEVQHTGDNDLADFKVPAALGITCVKTKETALTAWESKTQVLSGVESATASQLAGAMRAFRVSRRGDIPEEIMPLVAGFLGPVLLGFVSWVLGQARKDGVKRLYFVARDCQMACAVGQALAACFGNIDCRYLYASRQALFLPAATALSPEGLPSLRRDFETPALGALLAKLELTYEQVRPAWERVAGAEQGNYVLKSGEDWDRFWTSLNAEPLRSQILANLERRRAAALAYFKSAGLADGVPWALVDLGWHLTGQRAIKQILTPSGGGDDCRGYYLGLSNKRCGQAEAGPATALFDEMGRGQGAGAGDRDLLFAAATLLEHVLGVAGHNGVSHYEMTGAEARPVCRLPEPSNQYKEFAGRLRAGAALFARDHEALALLMSERGAARAAVGRLVELFVRHPSREMAEAMAGVSASIDQNNLGQTPVVMPLTFSQTLNLCLPHRMRESLGLAKPRLFWRGGAIALTNGGLKRLLNLRSWAAHATERNGDADLP